MPITFDETVDTIMKVVSERNQLLKEKDDKIKQLEETLVRVSDQVTILQRKLMEPNKLNPIRNPDDKEAR